MTPATMHVLRRLEARSQSEQQRLQELRSLGGAAVRRVASELMLDVGRDVGALLNMFTRSANAQRVVEVGASVGYSSIWIAEALSCSGGSMLSIEFDAAKCAELRENLADAGLDHIVKIYEGDAAEGLRAVEGPLDLVLLDHWKESYARDFDTLWPHVRRGGVVVADNIHLPAKNAAVIRAFLDHVEAHPDSRTVVLGIADGISVTMKV